MIDLSTSTSEGTTNTMTLTHGIDGTIQGGNNSSTSTSALSTPGIASTTSINPNIPRPPLFPQPPNQQPNPFPHALAATLSLPPNPNDDPALQAQTTEELMAICRAFIEQLRSGSAPWLLQRLNNTYGSMPEGPDEFSYWMALVSSIFLMYWILSPVFSYSFLRAGTC